ncbi:MAG: glutathione synthase [Deltaproteobacteria bacterium]|nr:glutathione synthase [Deltaproteobacteria bacterium]
MRLCFVVNSVRTQRPTYTTSHLACQAARRGHEVWLAAVDGLSLASDGRVLAQAVALSGKPRDTRELVATIAAAGAARTELALDGFSVVFLRNNPAAGADGDRPNPGVEFGRLLKRSGVLVVNDPEGLLRAGSKMYLEGFPAEIRPRTLITRSAERVRAFLGELDGAAILKPLAGFGGQNVFYLARGQTTNLNQMIAAVKKDGYVIVQEYLPAVARGDKRVLLLGGEPIEVGGHVAAYRRMRPKDDIRNNMHVGGSRRRATFGAAERRICELVRPRLVADGLYLVGLDVVGDKLLEINVYAPGGIHNINELYGVNVGEAVIADLERWVEARAARGSGGVRGAGRA